MLPIFFTTLRITVMFWVGELTGGLNFVIFFKQPKCEKKNIALKGGPKFILFACTYIFEEQKKVL